MKEADYTREAEHIKAVLHQFEYAGLISGNIDDVVECLSESILGIGIGEQGIVKSKEDVRRVAGGTRKSETDISHTIEYNNVEVVLHTEDYASACAEVIVTSHSPKEDHHLQSRFFQLLSLLKRNGIWKICALHASAPVVSEENIEAYPLKIAEKTLESLRKKIGEEVYLAEEQYRKAILADTIAFYIINLTQDIFEKCQLNSDACIDVQPGTSLKQFIEDNAESYIVEDDINRFMKTFILEDIEAAYKNGISEFTCEYRLKLKNGAYMWVVSILRLMADSETGDIKGIMYVRDASQTRQEKAVLLEKASRDSMTGLYNKEALSGAVEQILSEEAADNAVCIMLDIDNFKYVNDTYGHPVGDEVLIKLAHTIKRSFSEQVWSGRLGGDEFCIFIPYAGKDNLWERELQKFWSGIGDIRLPKIPDYRLSCSIGVARRQPQDICFKHIYEKADKALYSSKNNGKGMISFFEELC